jgi:hypothetical protein
MRFASEALDASNGQKDQLRRFVETSVALAMAAIRKMLRMQSQQAAHADVEASRYCVRVFAGHWQKQTCKMKRFDWV